VADPAEHKIETTNIGSYEIIAKLARGGMAELFLARDGSPEGFDKLVVLKKILPRYAENPRYVQLFLDEAKLAAGLDHPHIARVYDMGRADGHDFFTMEYVHGQDLRSILRRSERTRKPVPIGLAVQVASTVASALHHAHERLRPDGTLLDIVHRDVSPSNILVSYDGAIKLVDFGVAKATSNSARTRTGAVKGKVAYMSPEQARGGPTDRRSDVFSLGVVLWELVAIRRLFKSENDLATIQSTIHKPPPPLAGERKDCPAELDRIIARALDKEPGTRYQTAQELQRDLETLAREHKLDPSSIWISYLNDQFAPEIAAWKEAQESGTVTLISQSDIAMPASDPSDADGAFFDDGSNDELEQSDELEQDEADVASLPARAGSINGEPAGGAEHEATEFGPPPVMLADDALVPEPPKIPVASPAPASPEIPGEELEHASTTVQLAPFEEDSTAPTPRLETAPAPRPQAAPKPRPEDAPTALMGPLTPLVEPPPPPPAVTQALAVELPAPTAGSPPTALAAIPVTTPAGVVSDVMIPRRWWIIGGIIVGVVLIIVILAMAFAKDPERAGAARDAPISS